MAAHFGEAQTLVLVTLIYGVAIGPASVVMGALRRDLLSKRGLRRPESAWNEADTVERPDLERARRLF